MPARPAALLVKAAGATGLLSRLGRTAPPPADVRSTLSVLSLDVRGGEEVVLAAVEGADAELALEKLSSFLTSTDA